MLADGRSRRWNILSAMDPAVVIIILVVPRFLDDAVGILAEGEEGRCHFCRVLSFGVVLLDRSVSNYDARNSRQDKENKKTITAKTLSSNSNIVALPTAA